MFSENSNLNDIDVDNNHINHIYPNLTECKNYKFEEFNNLNIDVNKDLKILNWNIRSLSAHYDELIGFLTCINYKFDIISLTESWLSDSNQHLYNVDGYDSFHSLRPPGKRGGGITVLVNSDLKAKCIKNAQLSNDCLETLFIDIKTKDNKHLFLGSVYKPPSANSEQFINSMTEIISSIHVRQSDQIIVCGDFNINLLEIDSINDNAAINLLTSMNALSLLPTISIPTRNTDTSNTLIDNFFTNIPTDFLSGCLYSDVSDHLPIFLIQKNCIKNERNDKPVKIEYRLVNDLTIANFAQVIRDNNFSSIYNCNDCSKSVEILTKILNEAYHSCCPIKVKTVSPRTLSKPWITNSILQNIKKRQNMYSLQRKNLISKENYNRFKNFVTAQVRRSKKDYYEYKLKMYKKDMKKTWGLINNIIKPTSKKSVKNIKSLTVNNTSVIRNEEIANAMNNFFTTIGKNIAESIPTVPQDGTFQEFLTGDFQRSFFFSPVTNNDIHSTIISMKNKRGNKTELPVNLLKHVSHIIAPVIAYIINQSLSIGLFPESLKIARVTPIPKGGDPTNVSNYRPISVLPLISKIFEKVAHKQLYNYLEQNEILSSSQFGFRRKKSTSHALLDQLQFIYSNIDEGNFVFSVFLDFRKAFDCVDHEILLSKLRHYGVRGIAQDWFKSYLNNRKQFTAVNGSESSLKNITHGVPQGSILGPLLFLLFINDLTHSSTYFKYILFADDSTLSTTFNETESNIAVQTINSELKHVSKWLKVNKISINIDKTKYILFSYRKELKLPPIYIGNSQVIETSHTKFLGVHLDQHLTFKQHVNFIHSKASKSLGVLYKLKFYLPHSALKLLYQTMLHPYFAYGIEAWFATYSNVTDKLKVLQKKAIRVINNLPYNEHTSQYFKSNKILKLNDLYNYQILRFMFNITNNQIQNFSYINVRQQEVHNHNTRTRNQLVIPQFSQTKSQFALAYSGVKLWNALPQELKIQMSLSNFSKKLKLYQIEAYV